MDCIKTSRREVVKVGPNSHSPPEGVFVAQFPSIPGCFGIKIMLFNVIDTSHKEMYCRMDLQKLPCTMTYGQL